MATVLSKNFGPFVLLTGILYAMPALAASSGVCLDTSAAQTPVYIIMGQSNADGVGQVNQIPNVTSDFNSNGSPFMIWNNIGSTQWPANSWQHGQAVQSMMQYAPTAATPFDGFGPDMMIASQLMNNGVKNFYIFKYAVGGSYLAYDPGQPWWGQRGQGGIYDQALAAFNTALSQLSTAGCHPAVKAIFWMQGESDASSSSLTGLYPANLNTFITQSRQDFLRGSTTAPFVMGLVDSVTGEWKYAGIVRDAQFVAALSYPNVDWVETNDLPVYSSVCNTLAVPDPRCVAHYTTSGQYWLGVRFFNSYEQMAFNKGTPPVLQHLNAASTAVAGQFTVKWDNVDEIFKSSSLYNTVSPLLNGVQVQVSNNNGNTWANATTSSCNLNSGSCSITTVVSGSYLFRARAISSSSGLNSPWSNYDLPNMSSSNCSSQKLSCGDDGSGGSCGLCARGSACTNGKCVSGCGTAIDGGWSNWGLWPGTTSNFCSSPGRQHRTCTSPSQSCGGDPCIGEDDDPTCPVANASTSCAGGNLYYYDSYGNQGTLDKTCSGSCNLGTNICCMSNSYISCSGGNLYNYDSCGKQGALYSTCPLGCKPGSNSCAVYNYCPLSTNIGGPGKFVMYNCLGQVVPSNITSCHNYSISSSGITGNWSESCVPLTTSQTVYSCPNDSNTGSTFPWNWIDIQCLGQISTLPACSNYGFWNNGMYTLRTDSCTPIKLSTYTPYTCPVDNLCVSGSSCSVGCVGQMSSSNQASCTNISAPPCSGGNCSRSDACS